ncbi:unnamed protein product [Wuchereria bancrofti]|uniref:EB domain-containing protein n=1 Tax=Wuchereria bancrofti TaxID=6293 RepID=A0A3P7E773_WUCBA|nr:unnamed protein product [Wuchereria bancrofti]
MDSVDNRINGSIGTIDVNNSYCNEISITCQCKLGYELKLDEIIQLVYTGSCVKMEKSKFANQASTFDETNLIDFLLRKDTIENDTFPVLKSTSLKDDSEDLERYLFQIDKHYVPNI